MRFCVQQARDLRDHVFGLVTAPAKHRDGIADVADDSFEPVNRDSFGFFDVRHVLTSLVMEAFLKFAAITNRVGARYRSITEGPLARSFSDGSENPRRSARSTKTDRRVVATREETADCPTLRTRVCEAELRPQQSSVCAHASAHCWNVRARMLHPGTLRSELRRNRQRSERASRRTQSPEGNRQSAARGRAVQSGVPWWSLWLEKMTTREPADWGRRHPPAIRAPSEPQFRFDRPTGSDGNVDAAMEVGRFERRHARPGALIGGRINPRRSNCERGPILSGPREWDPRRGGFDLVCTWFDDRDVRASDGGQRRTQAVNHVPERCQCTRRPNHWPRSLEQVCVAHGLIETSHEQSAQQAVFHWRDRYGPTRPMAATPIRIEADHLGSLDHVAEREAIEDRRTLNFPQLEA